VETHEQTFEKPHRPWLRWLKRIGWSLLALTILIACRTAWHHHQVTRKLNEALTELDRTDPGWRLADIEAAREQIPEEENSARVVVAAAKLLPKDWPPKEFADRFADLTPEAQLAPDDFAALIKELSHLEPALKEARTLFNLPRGRHHITYRTPFISTIMNDQAESRRVKALLHYDALRHVQNGDAGKAIRACRAAFNAGRSLGDEPLSISQLVRNACIFSACHDLERILAQSEPPPEELAAVRKTLRDEDVFPDLLIIARGERAAMHEILLELENRQYEDDPQSGTSNWWGNLVSWVPHEKIREEHPAMLALLSRFITVAQLPEAKRTPAALLLSTELRDQGQTKELARMILSALDIVNESCLRKHAYLRCMTIALAAERYRQANKSWPVSLDKLCPQFLAAVPRDPLDGEPLRYRHVEDGVVIYSVSSDGADNNGNLDREHPNQPGADIGCRLWDVAKRRQPPRPKPLPNPE
jgi:hypothetical protein